MLQGNQAHQPQLLSPCALQPMHHTWDPTQPVNKYSLKKKKKDRIWLSVITYLLAINLYFYCVVWEITLVYEDSAPKLLLPRSTDFLKERITTQKLVKICEIDSQGEFDAVWLGEPKLGLCNNLEERDGEGGGREVQEGADLSISVADSFDVWQKPTQIYNNIANQLSFN